MGKKPKRAVGYIRVSTVIQAKEGESLSTQNLQITDFAKQKGWHLDSVYADEGISGAKIERRTNFQKMVNDAKEGKFEVIIFTKLSRFARNAREYMNLSYDLEKHGISLVSIKENIDPTNGTGKMIAGILALFVEWERETIKEQMYENKMNRWRDKRTFIGRPPYGYSWDKENNCLEIKKEEAEVFQLLVKMYVDQGMSFHDICINLRRKGIKCKRANWSSSTISYMFKNPAYYGNYTVNQFEYEDGTRGSGSKRTKRKKPDSEHIVYDITALITKKQWDQIQKRTEFNKFKSKRSNRTNGFFLRDVLHCGRCGGRVKPKLGTVRKDGSTPRYYACYWASTSKKNIMATGRSKKCSLPYLKAEDVEKIVWNDLWSNYRVGFALNPEKAGQRLFDTDKYKDRKEQQQGTINRLELELKKKQRARDNIFMFMEDENINKDDFSRRLNVNRDQILELEDNLNNARFQNRELESLHIKEQETRDFLVNYKSKFKHLWRDIAKLDLDDRKMLVESMLRGKIEVDSSEESEEYGACGIFVEFKHKWNIDILQRFMNEGKIYRLNQNSSDYSP